MKNTIITTSSIEGHCPYSLFKSYENLDQLLVPRRQIHTVFNSDRVPTSYYELKVLGRGAFSKIVLAEDINTGERVAIKMADTSSPHGIEIATASLLHEITILKVSIGITGV
jgi:hypothetical protein